MPSDLSRLPLELRPAADLKALIVIPCLNESNFLERLIVHLRTTNKTDNKIFVIVDGGSTDGTQNIAEHLAANNAGIFFLHNPKRLQSAAMNLAVEQYGQDYDVLIRIDAHADYPDRYCDVLMDEAQRVAADSVVVTMDTRGKTNLQGAIAAAQNSKLGNGGSQHRNLKVEGAWVDHGHHALMRIKAFRSVGGYDERFSHNEDAELDIRLRKNGSKIWLTSQTHMTYFPRSTFGGLFRQYRGYGSGRAQTLFKHHLRPKIRQLIPVLVLPALLLALFSFIFLPALLPSLIWIFAGCATAVKLAFEKRDTHLLMAAPAILVMHFAWALGFWKVLLNRFWAAL